MNIKIREFKEEDAKAVGSIGKKSWFYTYSHIFDQKYIEEKTVKSYNPKNIKKTAVHPELTKMFVAVLDGEIVGFSQPSYYNFWDPETFDPHKMMLSRIYILPSFMRKGIGSKLLEVSEEWILEQGYDEYFLYVHKDNSIGLNFYLKKGFEIKKDANEDDELLLRKRIS